MRVLLLWFRGTHVQPLCAARDQMMKNEHTLILVLKHTHTYTNTFFAFHNVKQKNTKLFGKCCVVAQSKSVSALENIRSLFWMKREFFRRTEDRLFGVCSFVKMLKTVSICLSLHVTIDTYVKYCPLYDKNVFFSSLHFCHENHIICTHSQAARILLHIHCSNFSFFLCIFCMHYPCFCSLLIFDDCILIHRFIVHVYGKWVS